VTAEEAVAACVALAFERPPEADSFYAVCPVCDAVLHLVKPECGGTTLFSHNISGMGDISAGCYAELRLAGPAGRTVERR
jgi:hypothetical protein